MPFVAAPIKLDHETRAVLEARVAAHTSPQRDVKRARIILLAADDVSSAQISREVGMHESNVAQWRKRFLQDGLDGLDDLQRSGRPEEILEEVRTGGIKVSLSHLWTILRSTSGTSRQRLVEPQG
jgi:hypothetical protein